MPKVKIDGFEVEVPDGTTILNAARQIGGDIVPPAMCYYSTLQGSGGKCRTCLVQVTKGSEKDPRPMPKLVASCQTFVQDGMEVANISSEQVLEARRGVVEFLLLNHPLDCPICDQAGECKLQEFSLEYGKGGSRFRENKVKKPKNVVIGPRVTLDDERCILCSRCIRFMQEIAKDDCLGFVNRGSYSTLTVAPGRQLDSNYSLNTVDICPVGALTSSDFRFKMRVWFLKETKTIDVHCGTGSNIVIGSREGVVYRITPRDNDDVNQCWLPDSHRLDFQWLHDPERLAHPMLRTDRAQTTHTRVTWALAIQEAARRLQSSAPGGTAVVASARLTNEELFLAARLASRTGAKLTDVVPRWGEPDGILIAADRNPNTNGARLLGLCGDQPGERLKDIVQGVRGGAIRSLVVLGEDPATLGLSPEDLAKLDTLILTDILPHPGMAAADIVLPSAAWAEKRGSMFNIKGRLQRLNQAIPAPGDARPDYEILADLLAALGEQPELTSIEDVFRVMGAATPQLDGLSLSKIGDLGIQLLDIPEAWQRPPVGAQLAERSATPIAAA